MKECKFLLVIVAAFIVQVSVIDYFRIFRVAPDLLLICVILVSLYTQRRSALMLSFLCGVLKDCLGVNPLGFYTVLFPLIGSVTVRLSRKLTIDNGIFGAFFTLIAAFLSDLCVRVALGFLGVSVRWGIMMRIFAVSSLYTAVFFLLSCRLLKPLLYPVSKQSYL